MTQIQLGTTTSLRGKWKPYFAYKDSDVEWLGKIPEHWEVRRSDGFLEERREGFDPKTMEGIKVFYYSIPLIMESGDGQLTDGSEIDSNKLLLQGGELLISKLNPRKSRVLVAKQHLELTICSSEFVVLRLRNNDISIRFALYLYSSEYVRQFLSAQVESATRSHQRVNVSAIAKMWTCLPPLPEQRTIVAFLDRETAKINILIAKKERLIELLQEKRTALISHAVMKGLDPIVPMEDSGVEWLGEIPEHWEVLPLKRLARIRYGLGQPPVQMEEGMPFVRATNVKSGVIVKEGMLYVDPEDVPPGREALLSVGDIIVVRSGAYTGDSAIVSQEYDGAIAGYDMVVSMTRGFSPYIAWQLLTKEVYDLQFGFYKLRAAQPHLNAEELGNTLLLVPPLSVQRTIVAYLDQETAKIDALISRIREGIEKLKEYSSALISAAVTGKIDVRG